jgi:hypothetical protein
MISRKITIATLKRYNRRKMEEPPNKQMEDALIAAQGQALAPALTRNHRHPHLQPDRQDADHVLDPAIAKTRVTTTARKDRIYYPIPFQIPTTVTIPQFSI